MSQRMISLECVKISENSCIILQTFDRLEINDWLSSFYCDRSHGGHDHIRMVV